MNIILIYFTIPAKKEAAKIARHLLNKKLIACVNIFPADSLYKWKGKIAEENEYILIAKTISKNYLKIKNNLEKIHPYSVPCIIKISASANKKYLNWLKGEIK
jgi:periplasmic divalent cation tolerance protein